MENLKDIKINTNKKNNNISENVIIQDINFEILGIAKKNEEITINYYGKLLKKIDKTENTNICNTTNIIDDGILYYKNSFNNSNDNLNTAYNLNSISKNVSYSEKDISNSEKSITFDNINDNVNATYINSILNPIKDIYLCYGYGNSWNRKETIKMQPVNYNDKKYYQCKIKIADEDTIYFCFMDNNHNWDLDNTSSYNLNILKNMDYVSKSENEITDTDENSNKFFKSLLKNLSKSFFSFLNKLGVIFGKSI